MTKLIKAIRGMNDILPEQISGWHYVEKILTDIAQSYGYNEIRFPVVEQTELFKRSIGELTDIVGKEMYTFIDRNGDSLTLRPEGTACCVRAGIQHGLFYNQTQKLWYLCPLFRRERPQKGRYRQFHQFGVEAFGFTGPDIDSELILLTNSIWEHFNLNRHVKLQINSLGTKQARNDYIKLLAEYFNKNITKLDEDSLKRLEKNPLRILDSKNPQLQDLIKNAPKLLNVIDEDSKQHFAKLCKILDSAGMDYEINPHLVRGLDYYSGTVFEWVNDESKMQGTICAGGRFDTLVEQLGGKFTPAIGFALGIERLLNLLLELNLIPNCIKSPHAYMVVVGEKAEEECMLLASQFRKALPKSRLILNCGGGSLKSQFKKADKSGAEIALIIGEDELNTNCMTVKYLRADRQQETLSISAVQQLLARLISKD